MARETLKIVETYLKKLLELERLPASTWSNTRLPFSKEIIEKALLAELEALDQQKSKKDKETRRALVISFVRLSYFISPDDAQLLGESEKLLAEVAHNRSNGKAYTEEDKRRLRGYEKPWMKIRAKISQEERHRIAQIAAYNAGGSLEKDENNQITLRLRTKKKFFF